MRSGRPSNTQQIRSQSSASNQNLYVLQPIKTVNGQIHIKKYKKIKKVGQGSYSKCYLVQTVNSDSTYVVKIIPKKRLQVLIKEKLVYEIKIHQSLLHENVVHLDHWFQDETNQYIFMEYCCNGNLESKLQQNQHYSEEEIRRLGWQVLQGLRYIHSQLVLHRDLKLCNFYLDQNDNVKVGDFGFACQLNHPDQKKRQTCGTPNYIAPEALSGFGYSFSADVWGFGVMLYRMKFQECPFQGKTVVLTLENVKTCQYSFPKKAKISKELKDLIEKIFVLNYDDRLTFNDISRHPFFEQKVAEKNKIKEKIEEISKAPDRGFSLKRLFSLGKDKPQEKKNSSIIPKKEKSSKKKQKQLSPPRPKRSNSCQTFKQIKEIMKTKTSNGNIGTNQTCMTSLRTDPHTQNITLTSSNVVCRESKGSKTIRDIIEMNSIFSIGSGKREETSAIGGGTGSRASKLNDFIKSQQNTLTLKQQIRKNRVQGSTASNQINLRSNEAYLTSYNNSKSSNNPMRNHLVTLTHRYLLPQRVQIEKDIVIVHYKPELKQILYSGNAYYLYRNKNIFYNKHGQEQDVDWEKLPKVLKYVIENNLTVEDPERNSYGGDQILDSIFEPGLQDLIQKLPSSYLVTKQALVLKYRAKQEIPLYCAKMPGQECFYIETEKVSLMYGGNLQIVEGVVIQRIYMGIVRNLAKKF